MMGVFVSLDLFLFYIFWEVMLLPMYFLIGIWGGPRREYAAIKFFLYTLAGTVFMLLAFIWFYLNCDPGYLVDGTSVTQSRHPGALARRVDSQGLTILGLMAVKIVWVCALHRVRDQRSRFSRSIRGCPTLTSRRPRRSASSWPACSSRWAPTAFCGSISRCCPRRRMAALDLASLRRHQYPLRRLCAMAQKDLKKLVAYSSVSHMGF